MAQDLAVNRHALESVITPSIIERLNDLRDYLYVQLGRDAGCLDLAK